MVNPVRLSQPGEMVRQLSIPFFVVEIFGLCRFVVFALSQVGHFDGMRFHAYTPQFSHTLLVSFTRFFQDILCGKDRACALHKGSQRFRAVIDSYRARYQKATTKYDKMQITKEIYEVLSQKSRFLKYVAEDRAWEEITPLAGRDKVSLGWICRSDYFVIMTAFYCDFCLIIVVLTQLIFLPPSSRLDMRSDLPITTNPRPSRKSRRRYS